jgi:hypothetical protein
MLDNDHIVSGCLKHFFQGHPHRLAVFTEQDHRAKLA